MALGIKRHQSPVLGREIVIVNHKTIELARKFMSGVQDDPVLFLQKEIDILRDQEEDTIRQVFTIKELFKDCEIDHISETK